eukprot:1184531-Prorocentrum_minimum.AAC.2
MPRAPEDALNVCTRVPLHSRSHLPSEEKHAGRPVSKPPAIQWSWYEGAMTPPLVFGTSARVRKTGGICVRNAKDSVSGIGGQQNPKTPKTLKCGHNVNNDETRLIERDVK